MLITVTVLSAVDADITGSVPCFFSFSFNGRNLTTTWTEEDAFVGDDGGRRFRGGDGCVVVEFGTTMIGLLCFLFAFCY